MAQIGANVPLAAKAARDVPGRHCLPKLFTKCETSFLSIEANVICPIAGVRPEGPDSSDLDVRAAEAGAPATFFCPISFKCFRDPVLLPTGQTYVTFLCLHATSHAIFITFHVHATFACSSCSSCMPLAEHDMSRFVCALCVCLSCTYVLVLPRRIHLCNSEAACMTIPEELS